MKSEVEVPEGWTVKKLGSLVESWGDGGTPSRAKCEYFGGDIPWVVIGDICYKIFDTKEQLTDKGFKNSSAKLWKKGSVILSTGASIGNVGIAMKDMCTKQGIIGIETKECLYNEFLARFFENNKRYLNRISQGSTIKEVRIPLLKNIRVLLPPLNEQQKIADILSKVDEQIDFTEKIIDKTEELKKGLMQKLLTKGIGHNKFKKTEFGEIPEKWDIVKLGDCVEQRKETILPSSEGKTMYVGLEHIDSGVTWLSRCGTDFSIKSLKYKFSENSILYGKLRPYLDKAVLTTKEGICSTDIIVIQSKENSLNEFILPILHSRRFLDYANSTTKGSNLPRTSWKSISKFIIPFPSLDEQKQIASILSKVDEQIQDNKKELNNLKELKKGLMQDLLTGKVRVSV